MNALSNVDILHILDSYGIAINGVVSKDELPTKLNQGWYIINLQNHNAGDGTHWTCFKNCQNGESIYFDSFGFDAPAHLHNCLGKYNFNKCEIQNIDSSACGWFCIALIKYCNKQTQSNSILMNRFTSQFSKNTICNDSRLINILNL